MRPLQHLPAGIALAFLAAGACITWRDDPDVHIRQHPRGAAFHWAQRKSEDGRVHDEGLFQAMVAHQRRLAAPALAAGGPSNWTLLGPGNIGGRIRSILIHPTSPATMWVGSVGGGVWKSTDAGASWHMLPDLPGVVGEIERIDHRWV